MVAALRDADPRYRPITAGGHQVGRDGGRQAGRAGGHSRAGSRRPVPVALEGGSGWQVVPVTPVRRAHPARPVSPAVLRRRRVAAGGALAAAVLSGALALQATLGHARGGPLTATGGPGGARPAAAQVWVVRPGDTLWGIAEAIQPHGDVRPLVDRLAAEVGGRPLQVGERIPLP